MVKSLSERLHRERLHGNVILSANESNWGWHTVAGRIRKERRTGFLVSVACEKSLKVLEIGCGTGTFTGELYKHFSDLTCIDISDVLLNEAKKRFPSVHFVNGDAHKTDFPPGSFDVVLGCSVLHHLDWDMALMEFKRLLRPGGKIRFSEPNLLNPQIFLQKNWPWLKKRIGDSPDEYAFSASQIKKSLSNAGFKNIETTPFEFLHPSTPSKLISSVIKFESALEKTWLRNFGGSLKISAEA